MANYEQITEQISAKTGSTFRASSPFDLAKLETIGLPESVLTFYQDFEPAECVEGQVRLWPIEHILEENEALTPGCYSSKYGYIVFATTFCGDTYCFDLAEGGTDPRIVLISHEMIGKNSTPENFQRLAKPVARNLKEFLTQFLHDDIDEQCIYK